MSGLSRLSALDFFGIGDMNHDLWRPKKMLIHYSLRIRLEYVLISLELFERSVFTWLLGEQYHIKVHFNSHGYISHRDIF